MDPDPAEKKEHGSVTCQNIRHQGKRHENLMVNIGYRLFCGINFARSWIRIRVLKLEPDLVAEPGGSGSGFATLSVQ
jgi:hypothetical protein